MVLTHCRDKWPGFLQEISKSAILYSLFKHFHMNFVFYYFSFLLVCVAQVSQKNGVAEQLEPLIGSLFGFLENNLTDDDDLNDEAAEKKLAQQLSSALLVVALQLPVESPQCTQV